MNPGDNNWSYHCEIGRNPPGPRDNNWSYYHCQIGRNPPGPPLFNTNQYNSRRWVDRRYNPNNNNWRHFTRSRNDTSVSNLLLRQSKLCDTIPEKDEPHNETPEGINKIRHILKNTIQGIKPKLTLDTNATDGTGTRDNVTDPKDSLQATTPVCEMNTDDITLSASDLRHIGRVGSSGDSTEQLWEPPGVEEDTAPSLVITDRQRTAHIPKPYVPQQGASGQGKSRALPDDEAWDILDASSFDVLLAKNEDGTKKNEQNLNRKVLTELMSMSKDHLKNVLENPQRFPKIEAGISYMIKDTRMKLSQQLRQFAEAKMIGQDNFREGQFMKDIESLIDADLAVDLLKLPSELIYQMGNIFQLDLHKPASDTESICVTTTPASPLSRSECELGEQGGRDMRVTGESCDQSQTEAVLSSCGVKQIGSHVINPFGAFQLPQEIDTSGYMFPPELNDVANFQGSMPDRLDNARLRFPASHLTSNTSFTSTTSNIVGRRATESQSKSEPEFQIPDLMKIKLALPAVVPVVSPLPTMVSHPLAASMLEMTPGPTLTEDPSINLQAKQIYNNSTTGLMGTIPALADFSLPPPSLHSPRDTMTLAAAQTGPPSTSTARLSASAVNSSSVNQFPKTTVPLARGGFVMDSGEPPPAECRPARNYMALSTCFDKGLLQPSQSTNSYKNFRKCNLESAKMEVAATVSEEYGTEQPEQGGSSKLGLSERLKVMAQMQKDLPFLINYRTALSGNTLPHQPSTSSQPKAKRLNTEPQQQQHRPSKHRNRREKDKMQKSNGNISETTCKQLAENKLTATQTQTNETNVAFVDKKVQEVTKIVQEIQKTFQQGRNRDKAVQANKLKPKDYEDMLLSHYHSHSMPEESRRTWQLLLSYEGTASKGIQCFLRSNTKSVQTCTDRVYKLSKYAQTDNAVRMTMGTQTFTSGVRVSTQTDPDPDDVKSVPMETCSTQTDDSPQEPMIDKVVERLETKSGINRFAIQTDSVDIFSMKEVVNTSTQVRQEDMDSYDFRDVGEEPTPVTVAPLTTDIRPTAAETELLQQEVQSTLSHVVNTETQTESASCDWCQVVKLSSFKSVTESRETLLEELSVIEQQLQKLQSRKLSVVVKLTASNMDQEQTVEMTRRVMEQMGLQPLGSDHRHRSKTETIKSKEGSRSVPKSAQKCGNTQKKRTEKSDSLKSSEVTHKSQPEYSSNRPRSMVIEESKPNQEKKDEVTRILKKDYKKKSDNERKSELEDKNMLGSRLPGKGPNDYVKQWVESASIELHKDIPHNRNSNKRQRFGENKDRSRIATPESCLSQESQGRKSVESTRTAKDYEDVKQKTRPKANIIDSHVGAFRKSNVVQVKESDSTSAVKSQKIISGKLVSGKSKDYPSEKKRRRSFSSSEEDEPRLSKSVNTDKKNTLLIASVKKGQDASVTEYGKHSASKGGGQTKSGTVHGTDDEVSTVNRQKRKRLLAFDDSSEEENRENHTQAGHRGMIRVRGRSSRSSRSRSRSRGRSREPSSLDKTRVEAKETQHEHLRKTFNVKRCSILIRNVHVKPGVCVRYINGCILKEPPDMELFDEQLMLDPRGCGDIEQEENEYQNKDATSADSRDDGHAVANPCEMQMVSNEDSPVTSPSAGSLSEESDSDDVDLKNIHFNGHTASILHVKVSGKLVLAACEDARVYCYSVKSGKVKRTYNGHEGKVTCMTVWAKRKKNKSTFTFVLITGCYDGRIRTFGIKTANLLCESKPLDNSVQCLAESWDFIFVGLTTGLVVRLKAGSLKVDGESVAVSHEAVLDIKLTTEGPRRVMIIATRSSPVMIRDAMSGLLLRSVSGTFSGTVYSLLVESNLVYCGCSDNKLPSFNFADGTPAGEMECGPGVIAMKIVSGHLFAASYDGNVHIYNCETRQKLAMVCGPGKMITSMDLYKTKLLVVSTSNQKLEALPLPVSVRSELKSS